MNGPNWNAGFGASKSVRRTRVRARVNLMLGDGASHSTIETAVPCYRDYINRWQGRFLEQRLDGLRARDSGQPPTVLTPAMEARRLKIHDNLYNTAAKQIRWSHRNPAHRISSTSASTVH
jgi:transposase